jgi:hypothetical protein
MNSSKINFQTENLQVDYITLTIENVVDQKDISRIASDFSNSLNFNSKLKDNETGQIEKLYSNTSNKYSVLIEKYDSNFHWVGILLKFSGDNAKQFFKLIKLRKVDWKIFKKDSISLSRFDLCYFRPNDLPNNRKLFDKFLVDSRSQILESTRTRHLSLKDNTRGKILKVNRRSNSFHYRVYEKDNGVRFELEMKKRQTKLVQDYLFNNQLEKFEHKLTRMYYQYSERLFPLDNSYTNWVVDFIRKYPQKEIPMYFLLTSYLENRIYSQEEEERLFHLLQFLSFIKSLNLNPGKDCQKYLIKHQVYYLVEFSLSQFVHFTGITISNNYQRKKILSYFERLQTIDPIARHFSDGSFRSSVIFPYVELKKRFDKYWGIEIAMAEQLFTFPYPFGFPKSFLNYQYKNDLRLKVRLIKSLLVRDQKKTFDLEELFNQVSLSSSQIVRIKKQFVRLLKELVEQKIIESELQIIYKNGTQRQIKVEELTVRIITRRIQYVKFNEIIKNKKY